jgi:hypothetical protein
MTGQVTVRKIKIEHEDHGDWFEVELDDAKVFVDLNDGTVVGGEHMRSTPADPVPEPPAGMLTFDDAYSIAVTYHPGNVSQISFSSNVYSVRVSGTTVRVHAYTGAIVP